MKLKVQGREELMRPLGGLILAVVMTGPLAGCWDPSAAQYVQTGKTRLEKGDARGAAIELKNALQLDPSLTEARFLFAKALLKIGDAAGAEVELGKLEKAGYDDNLVAPLLARAMQQLGKNEALVAKYRGVTLSQPAAMAELQVALGRSYLGMNRVEEATAAETKALAAVPDLLEALQLRARVAVVSGNAQEALAQTRSLIDQRPKEASNWIMLGDIQLVVGDMKQARSSYEQAIKINSTDTQAYLSLMPVLILGGDLQAASTSLAALEKLDGRNPRTLYFKAWLKMEQGDLKTAQEISLGLLKVLPENVDVLYLSGSIEARRNSLQRAVDYLGKAVALAPTQVRPRLLLANTQLRRGEAVRTLATLQPLLKQERPTADVLVLAAAATQRAGEPAEKSEKLLERAVATDSGHVGARVGLARARIERGDLASGVRDLRELSKLTADVAPDVTLVDALVRNKRLDEAIEALKALEGKPGGKVIAEMQRGRIELDRANVQQARSAFDAVLKENATHVPAIAALASLDVSNNEPDKAQARFQSLLDKDPGNAVARAALLRLSIDRGVSNPELIDMAQKAVKAAPGSRDLRVDLVRLTLAKPDPKQAAEAAQEALNLVGEDPELLALLGQAQLASDDTNLAVNTFTRLVSIRPGLPQPYMLLASAHKKRGDFTQSLQALRRGIEAAPDYAPLYQTLASSQTGNGQYAQAVQTAKQWQARDKNGWIGYAMEGDVYLRQQRFDAAAEAYRAGVAKNPAPLLAIRLHQMLNLAGKKDAATTFEAKRLADKPKDLQFLNYLGESSLQEGEFRIAEGRFRRALELDPKNPAILNNLAWVMGKQDQNASALEFATRAVEFGPKRPEFFDTKAELQAKLGRFEDALATQRQALILAPEVHIHRVHLAAYLVKSGKKNEAKEELNRIDLSTVSASVQSEVKRLLEQAK